MYMSGGMSEEAKAVCVKHLSAKELLRNKGICSKAWNQWEESSRALPKIGTNKQFEPNCSWLENKQIEKGLASRKFLLGIERVERTSQLASAEWFPEQKRARVTKKIGSEWANFGHEINANLYLIAEEALILLETECLELVWEGIPLSIQQAYEVLIESEGSDCTLDEYRVYSQLTRLGYRLQRFYYEKSLLERPSGFDEPVQRKKVIVNPENGLWMAGNHTETLQSSGSRQKPEVDNDVKEIVENMVVTINGSAETDKASTSNDTSSAEAEDSANEKPLERRMKNAKVEIISEQTILSPIKIVKDSPSTSEHNVSKWPGARIQRNVKLLPKRNDKLSLSVASTENPIATTPVQSKYEIVERTLDKRKNAQPIGDSPETKKSKHEVIELSDDEIEEIPRPMSRMEMLNCLPNIANQTFITENICKRYVPRGVRPRSTYRYDSRKLKQTNDPDRSVRTNSEPARNGSNINTIGNDSLNERNAIVPYRQQNSTFSNVVRNNYGGSNFSRNSNESYTQSVNHYSSNSMVMSVSAGICMQQIAFAQNRWSSYHMNLSRNSAVMGYAMQSVFMQNIYQMSCQQNQQPFANHQFSNRTQRYSSDRPWRGSSSTRSRGTIHSRTSPSPGTSRQHNENDVYEGTFAKVPGTSSWPELKQKWRDAKTITIDDEECAKYDEDANEIQVVEQTVKPLIGPKNARSFPEIYERLRIIKSAPDRTVRRKKSDLKISYNVYSSTQHYRKANPGLPMFRLVVTSRKENIFLQPVELNRLQQDGKGSPIIFAHVSNSSIAYIQPGIITLPNLI